MKNARKVRYKVNYFIFIFTKINFNKFMKW